MDEAIVVFSRKGIFQTTITARDVRSREHARKLWPLVSPGASRQMVTWVSPFFESEKLRRRSHFRVLPAQHTFNVKVASATHESPLPTRGGGAGGEGNGHDFHDRGCLEKS
jgi:hypothetical protein